MQKSLLELHNLLFKKKISSLDLAKDFLKQIESNHKLNAFISIDYSSIILQAKKADNLINTNNYKFLTGIPIANKDIFVEKKTSVTAGSKFLKNYFSPYNSSLIRRLKNLGMVIIGKTNMNEFCLGSNSLNLYYGNVSNALNNLFTSGGSSGGSSVSVSSNLAPVSLASDTGGSIRQPSSFNNVFGLKPTYGRISRYGMISYSSSLDQPGIISKNILDIGILLNSISGLDIRDNTTLNFKREDFTRYINKNWLLSNKDFKVFFGLKIGISKDYLNEIYDYNIRSNIEYILSLFELLGARIIFICFLSIKIIFSLYYTISSSEFSSNLSRFDGFRYGYISKIFNKNFNYFKNIRTEKFTDEVKKRIIIGNYILSSNKSKKYFYQSKRIRKFIINYFQNIFSICDIIICPISPVLPWYIYKKLNFKENAYIDFFTVFASLAGLPAINIPTGFIYKFNIKYPISFQIISNYCTEARIIQIAYEIQKNINFNL